MSTTSLSSEESCKVGGIDLQGFRRNRSKDCNVVSLPKGFHQIVWSPFIYENNVQIAPYNGISLTHDQASGSIWLLIKTAGRVKWKVGTVTTGHYHLRVSCPAYIPFGNKGIGITVNNGIKSMLSQSCDVSV